MKYLLLFIALNCNFAFGMEPDLLDLQSSEEHIAFEHNAASQTVSNKDQSQMYQERFLLDGDIHRLILIKVIEKSSIPFARKLLHGFACASKYSSQVIENVAFNTTIIEYFGRKNKINPLVVAMILQTKGAGNYLQSRLVKKHEDKENCFVLDSKVCQEFADILEKMCTGGTVDGIKLNLKFLEFIFKKVYINPACLVPTSGKTLLIAAIESKNTEVAEKLIELNIMLNGTDTEGKTALMHAVLKNMGLVSKLVSFVDINAVDNDGKTALIHFAKQSNMCTTQLIIQFMSSLLNHPQLDTYVVDSSGKRALDYLFPGSQSYVFLLKTFQSFEV